MNAPAHLAGDVDSGKYKLRVEDYLLLDEGGSFRGAETELVDGDVIVMSPEWAPHMRVKDEIAYRLRDALKALGLDLRVGTGGSVQLSAVDQPRPDVIVMRPVRSDRAIPRAALQLLVEVASTTLDFDLNEKAPLYARSAVPECWILDVNGRVIHQLWSPDGDRYRQRREIPFGDRITAATINSVAIDTADL